MKPRAITLTLFMFLSGCAYREQMTSGAIGCPEDEIVATPISTNLMNITWKATCRGKTFYCVEHGRAICTEELPKANQ